MGFVESPKTMREALELIAGQSGDYDIRVQYCGAAGKTPAEVLANPRFAAELEAPIKSMHTASDLRDGEPEEGWRTLYSLGIYGVILAEKAVQYKRPADLFFNGPKRIV